MTRDLRDFTDKQLAELVKRLRCTTDAYCFEIGEHNPFLAMSAFSSALMAVLATCPREMRASIASMVEQGIIEGLEEVVGELA